jgi:hypothetical protein
MLILGKVMSTMLCHSLTRAPPYGSLLPRSQPKLGAGEPLISNQKALRAFAQYVYLHTYLFVADF